MNRPRLASHGRRIKEQRHRWHDKIKQATGQDVSTITRARKIWRTLPKAKRATPVTPERPALVRRSGT